jgi:hypothetical protein
MGTGAKRSPLRVPQGHMRQRMIDAQRQQGRAGVPVLTRQSYY